MNITIYSTPTCIYCKMAKEFFNDHNLEYTEHNVAEDEAKREEMTQKSGQMGVPVIDINGTILVGFDQPKVEEAIKAANAGGE